MLEASFFPSYISGVLFAKIRLFCLKNSLLTPQLICIVTIQSNFSIRIIEKQSFCNHFTVENSALKYLQTGLISESIINLFSNFKKDLKNSTKKKNPHVTTSRNLFNEKNLVFIFKKIKSGELFS